MDNTRPGLKARPKQVTAARGNGPARSLRQLIWDRIDPHLTDCSSVIVIPDGSLTAVPWAALPGEEPGSYLLQDYAVSTAAYPQQIYGLMIREPVGSNGMTIAGGMDYDQETIAYRPASPPAEPGQLLAAHVPEDRGAALLERSGDRQSWPPLAGSSGELRILSKLFEENAEGLVAALTGSQSRETDAAALMSSSRYVHLATHGFFERPDEQRVYQQNLRKVRLFETAAASHLSGATVAGRNPLLLSGLVFGGANRQPRIDDLGLPTGEDGLLTAEEIVGLNLEGTELVVLSACETALGEQTTPGGGVFGLQKAFHRAGARTVVASLWSVDDRATQTLMVEFYRNLWERGLGRQQALREAQLTMIRHFNPRTGGLDDKLEEAIEDAVTGGLPAYFWAAFTLSGDWR